jgi:hypothetical protein
MHLGYTRRRQTRRTEAAEWQSGQETEQIAGLPFKGCPGTRAGLCRFLDTRFLLNQVRAVSIVSHGGSVEMREIPARSAGAGLRAGTRPGLSSAEAE